MKSSTTPKFRQAFANLSPEIQDRARKAFRLSRDDPGHPSIQFKKVGKIWSARVDSNFRALAHVVEGTAYWFWIGPHTEYDRLLSHFRKA